MRVHSYHTFLSMFYALDAAFEHKSTERLRLFLSEANPFLWQDEGSADPALYEDFSHAYSRHFGDQGATPEEARAFVRAYLDTQNSEYSWVDGNLVSAFDSVATAQLWEESLKEMAD
ncbi:hypothetical protein [Alloscardovia macacae]|uniref:Uncharacterized protein n=1 Tax=Alloscardovia macacae TaxID=1160091 RepID=A0A261F6Q6_9BIFI|nr:hypothetical protein [Alloscardovia macacae]OZG54758.1 hypothetical protein ALMA_0083 [Alloscardovia macacae]